MICKNCNNEVDDNLKFCNHCGKEMELTFALKENNPFRNYKREIDDINFNQTYDGKNVAKKQWLSPEIASNLRSVLHEICNVTKVIGKEIVAVGKKIIDYILEALRYFPNTGAGVVIIALLHGIVNAIPFLGGLLQSLLLPIDIAIVGGSFIKDLMGTDLFSKILGQISSLFLKTIPLF